MRILAFSDLHGDAEAARRIVVASAAADVVVGAGDFGIRGEGAAETIRLLASCRVPVVLVHGNHDDPGETLAVCERHAGLHYLHGGVLELAGMNFFGLGGEIPARSDAPWNATESEEVAADLLEAVPPGCVLVTHTPPLGVADLQRDGSHEGSVAIRDAIRLRRPALCLCGHIHHAWGTSGRVGGTPVHNLGPGSSWFDL